MLEDSEYTNTYSQQRLNKVILINSQWGNLKLHGTYPRNKNKNICVITDTSQFLLCPPEDRKYFHSDIGSLLRLIS